MKGYLHAFRATTNYHLPCLQRSKTCTITHPRFNTAIRVAKCNNTDTRKGYQHKVATFNLLSKLQAHAIYQLPCLLRGTICTIKQPRYNTTFAQRWILPLMFLLYCHPALRPDKAWRSECSKLHSPPIVTAQPPALKSVPSALSLPTAHCPSRQCSSAVRAKEAKEGQLPGSSTSPSTSAKQCTLRHPSRGRWQGRLANP